MSTIEKAMEKLDRSPGKSAFAKNAESIALKIQHHEQVAEPKVTTINTHETDHEGVAASQKKHKVLTIDDDRLKSLGMISSNASMQERMVRDEFRVIKHKLLKNAFGASHKPTSGRSNLVMVSSASSNEGKTFISINLALSIASEQDKTVLLIDADVLNPSVDQTLELGEQAGLIDYLSGEIDDVGEIIYPTTVPDLRIMPAGRAHHMSYELLSSDRMLALMQELANRYTDRIVVLDCPPLLGVVETVTLSNLIGQAVVVVEQNKTKVSDVKQAISLLNSEMNIGFIINKAVHNSSYKYGYGYGSTNKNK